MTPKLMALLERWNATGRCSFYYPRKRMVSLNGSRAITEKAAFIYLTSFFRN